MSAVDELIAFVRACLDRVEQDAPDIHETECAVGNYRGFRDGCDCGWPKRVLADVAAKRAILDGYAELTANGERLFDTALHMQWTILRQVVRALAQAYAGWDGWREEWGVQA